MALQVASPRRMSIVLVNCLKRYRSRPLVRHLASWLDLLMRSLLERTGCMESILRLHGARHPRLVISDGRI